MMTVTPEDAAANCVTAAAVIRRGRAVYGMTGSNVWVGGVLREG